MYGAFGNPRNLSLKFALNFSNAVISDFTPSAKQALCRVFSQCANPLQGSTNYNFLTFPNNNNDTATTTDRSLYGINSSNTSYTEEAIVTEMTIDTSYPENVDYPADLGTMSQLGVSTSSITDPTLGGSVGPVLRGVTVIFTISYNGNAITSGTNPITYPFGDSEYLLKKYLAGYVSQTGAVLNGLYYSLTNTNGINNLQTLFSAVNNLTNSGTLSYATSASTSLTGTGLLPSLICLMTSLTSSTVTGVITNSGVTIAPSNMLPNTSTSPNYNSSYNSNLLTTCFSQLLLHTPNLQANPSTNPSLPFS